MSQTRQFPNFGKVMIITIVMIIIATTFVPENQVQAYPGVNAGVSSAYSDSTLHDFYALKAMFKRNEHSVSKLTQMRNKLMGMVDRLREKNNKKWVDMQILYYDFNSSYQAAISHAYEARVEIYQHGGFSDKGKIINAYNAAATVRRLRGAVLGLVARVTECNRIMHSAYRLQRAK